MCLGSQKNTVVAVCGPEGLDGGDSGEVVIGDRKGLDTEGKGVVAAASDNVALAEVITGGDHEAVVSGTAVEGHAGGVAGGIKGVVVIATDDRADAGHQLSRGSEDELAGSRSRGAEDFHAGEASELGVGKGRGRGKGKGVGACCSVHRAAADGGCVLEDDAVIACSGEDAVGGGVASADEIIARARVDGENSA